MLAVPLPSPLQPVNAPYVSANAIPKQTLHDQHPYFACQMIIAGSAKLNRRLICIRLPGRLVRYQVGHCPSNSDHRILALTGSPIRAAIRLIEFSMATRTILC
jgi:hypothetical protein